MEGGEADGDARGRDYLEVHRASLYRNTLVAVEDQVWLAVEQRKEAPTVRLSNQDTLGGTARVTHPNQIKLYQRNLGLSLGKILRNVYRVILMGL